jgi:hypothetical protein
LTYAFARKTQNILIYITVNVWRETLTEEIAVGDKVVYSGIDGKQSIEGIVTYVIRDGSNPPWGYIVVHSPQGTSYICAPDKLVCIESNCCLQYSY